VTKILAAVFMARVGKRDAYELARNIAQVLVLEPLPVRYVVRETLLGRRGAFGPGSPWNGLSDAEINAFAVECARHLPRVSSHYPWYQVVSTG
jgi:hypothetical protein